jgi:hypothetical protein
LVALIVFVSIGLLEYLLRTPAPERRKAEEAGSLQRLADRLESYGRGERPESQVKPVKGAEANGGWAVPSSAVPSSKEQSRGRG